MSRQAAQWPHCTEAHQHQARGNRVTKKLFAHNTFVTWILQEFHNIEANQTIFAFDNSLNLVKKDDLFSTIPTCLRHPDVLSESHSSDQGCQKIQLIICSQTTSLKIKALTGYLPVFLGIILDSYRKPCGDPEVRQWWQVLAHMVVTQRGSILGTSKSGQYKWLKSKRDKVHFLECSRHQALSGSANGINNFETNQS